MFAKNIVIRNIFPLRIKTQFVKWRGDLLIRLAKRDRRLKCWASKGLLIAFIFILLCSILPDQVMAEKGDVKPVKLEVFPGFDGSYRGPWIPVRVKITNDNRVDLEGEVFARLFRNTQVIPFQKVQVAAGTSKEVLLLVPSDVAYSDTHIYFVAEGHQPVKVKMGGNTVADEVITVGILSESSSTGRFLDDISRNDADRSVEIYFLKEEEVPSIAEGLAGLDAIVINNFSLETLRPTQQQVILQWVKKGGTLLVAGGAGITQSTRGLESILPVQIEGTGTVSDLKGLSAYGKVPSVEKLSVSKGKLVEGGKALVMQEGMPLIASRSLGEGQVLYAAYDLSAAPLAEWSGNQKLWGELLLQHPIPSDRSWHEQYRPLLDGIQYIPSVSLPSLPMMALLFLVYVLMVGPLLYFILTRFRRREWGWWMIPLFSIAVSLLVYAYGNYVRGNDALLHNLALVQLNSSGEARATGVSGLVAPKEGTFHITTEKNTFAWPTSSSMSFTSTGMEKVMTHSNKSDIFFMHVPHWSMRSLFFDTTLQLGRLETNVAYQKDKLVGQVTNHTQLPFRDVGVLVGNNYHPIGNLAPGASAKIEIPYSQTHGKYPYDMVRTIESKKPLNPHEESLVQQLENTDISSSILLIGWTENSLVKHKVVGHSQMEEHLSLIYTPLEIASDKDGKIGWALGAQRPLIMDSTGQHVDRFDNTYYIAAGEKLTMEYKFDTQGRVEAHRIDFDMQYSIAAEIYNWSQNKWGKVALDKPITGKEAAEYLSPDNRLRIRLTGNGNTINPPLVGLEGKVSP